MNGDSSAANFEEYFDPISTISKILRCFEDDYRIPVLGLGARLWPLHCIVSHCFGLNSDIFNPLFDSVEDIHAELTASLREKKFLPQGPVIFSDVLRFARDFAKFCKEEDSRYYVVLVIMTNNELSDIESFKEELKLSCDFPLSVIICRVVPLKKISSTYETMGTLNTDLTQDPAKKEAPSNNLETGPQNQKKEGEHSALLRVYDQISEDLAKEKREILHAFCIQEKQQLELTETARQVFSKLLKQFVQYMEKKGKKPKVNEEGRSSNGRIKELKKELINKMNNRKKNLDKEKSIINRFLREQREKFRQRALEIGFDRKVVSRILDFRDKKEGGSSGQGFEKGQLLKQKTRSEAQARPLPKREVGLAAKDLNLLSELVGYLFNLKNIREKEPISLGQLKPQAPEKGSEAQLQKSANFEDASNRRVKPKEEIVFTREDNDNINSKWKQRQKDLYSKTQKFLRKLEQREIDFQKENFPEALFQKLEEGFFKLEEGKSEERPEDARDADDRAEVIYKGVRRQIKDYFGGGEGQAEEDSDEIYNSEEEVYVRLDTLNKELGTIRPKGLGSFDQGASGSFQRKLEFSSASNHSSTFGRTDLESNMSDVVSDSEFEKIMNIKERFYSNSSNSLNHNQRKTLKSIIKNKKDPVKEGGALKKKKMKFKEDNGEGSGKTPAQKKGQAKRVSFANSLLSQSSGHEVEQKQLETKSKLSILSDIKETK